MVKFIKRIISKKSCDDAVLREKYIIFCGYFGVFCNLLLFFVKFIIGTFMNSIAVTSDAFNNLTDMGSSIVVIIGAKMSSKLPDKEHPFGHGRIEYISSLIVSFIIMYVGIELFLASIEKIQNPVDIYYNIPMIVILVLSLAVKLIMYFIYGNFGKEINSTLLKASSKDSINDVISTSSIIAVTIIGSFLPFSIDGYVGVLVALYIIYSGFKIAKETVDIMLGTKPSDELSDKISELMLSDENILGFHDLIMHDYGPNRIYASVHAEISDSSEIIKIHDVIDKIEHVALEKYGVSLVIHMDPISISCEKTAELKLAILNILSEEEINAKIHDFRILYSEDKTINIKFDIVFAQNYSQKEQNQFVSFIKNSFGEKYSEIELTIDVDNCFL